jgi:multidrug efflux pump subunit AcrA (membrane-fusion protein)
MHASRRAILGVIAVSLAGTSSCGSEPVYVEPPAPRVTVAPPIRRTVTDYLEATGTAEAIHRLGVLLGLQPSALYEDLRVEREIDLMLAGALVTCAAC